MIPSPALQVKDLSVRLGGRTVLQSIDLQLQPGELLGLIGANGSGKSTLLRVIAGLLPMNTGDVLIAGHGIRSAPMLARAHLGFAVDPALLPDALQGWQCLELFAAARGLDRVPPATMALAQSLQLADVLYAQVARYSLGMRQKLSLCLALLGEPPLIVLDESLSGLDPLSVYTMKQALLDLVQTKRCAVILATHMLDATQSCMTCVALLHDGVISRTWDAAQLDALRTDPLQTLETQMVEHLREVTAAK